MRTKGHSKSLLVRIIVSPIRALVKARDMYVRSITNCGQSISYGNTMDGAGGFSSFPRSYSTATSTRSEENEDFAELMRAASARTIESRFDMDLVMKQEQQQKSSNGLSKSSSVGMAKIDEDMPFDLSYDGVVTFKPDSYPRSRSYAVAKRSVVF
ncbi:hypothetical protein TanjilG_01088 [Lupinus angustifolius]|uniref:Uncharacterized protein n=2 Tax=Lupinus angustifolius TaxID=3871 RepID=A0A1J7IMQ7_LUPAN|nr:PREDICTED: uncharacterized protein LOC109342289 [Lupinus angustifolius]XP_019435848.1 PREDICTED: uncharacterized protein LOC109342290 [Lupinus angustifolius]OIW15565.1 hypothetical protein TanjilG_01088 [Lupinus angustifolius]